MNDLRQRIEALEARERSRRRTTLCVAGVLAVSLPASLFAGTVTGLVTFVNGTPADAEEVNANFSALVDAIHDNDARLGNLGALTTSDNTDLVTAINELQAEIDAIADAAPEEGLLVWYDMESISGTTLLDQSGNGRHGTIVGGIQGNLAPGAVGGALDMRNTGYVQLPSSTAVTGASSRTICAWGRANTTSNAIYLFSSGLASTGRSFNARYAVDGTPGFMGFSDDHDPTGGPDAMDGDWHHTCLTYDGVNVTAYLDNVEAWSVPKSLNSDNADVFIGRHNYLDLFFNGVIDEYRYYDRVLTTEERTALFDARDPRPLVDGPEEGLLAYYDMSTIDGTTLRDQSGYGNDGVIVGGIQGNATTGRVGGALNMANTGYVQLPAISGVLGARDRTVAVWVKANSTGGYPFGAGINAASRSFNARMNTDGTPGFMGFANDFDPSGGTNVIDGAWHLVVYTYDGTAVRCYVDDVLEWTSTKSLDTGAGVVLGRHNNAAVYFPGELDQYRYYNRVLSASERSELYNGGAGL
jgi:hypothetical protein